LICFNVLSLVSILGLVDKRLRRGKEDHQVLFYGSVSILGLVDKRLRLLPAINAMVGGLGFNPWFSG